MSRRAAKLASWQKSAGPIVPVSATALIERAPYVGDGLLRFGTQLEYPGAVSQNTLERAQPKPARQPPPIALGAAQKAAKPSKYRNKPTNGYASKKEAKRAAELKLLEKVGQVKMLREQVKFVLIPKQEGERECAYIADFVYAEQASGAWFSVVEDVKGRRTAVYRIKRKLMLHVHGIRIRET